MTKGSKKRLIERVKSLMILLLSCSAVLLVLRTQSVMLGRDSRGERYAAGESGPIASEDAGGAVRPLRMAAAIQRGSEVVRYGVQYDQAGTDELYQQAYSLLVEALSSAGEPREISEEAWRQALSSAPGLYFDWQGEIPLTVLNGWLSVDNQTLAGTVRRIGQNGSYLLLPYQRSQKISSEYAVVIECLIIGFTFSVTVFGHARRAGVKFRTVHPEGFRTGRTEPFIYTKHPRKCQT